MEVQAQRFRATGDAPKAGGRQEPYRAAVKLLVQAHASAVFHPASNTALDHRRHAAPLAHRTANGGQRWLVEQTGREWQQFGVLAGDVLGVQAEQRVDVAGHQGLRLSSGEGLQQRPQAPPERFELAVVGRQGGDQLADADSVRAGHGLDQRREEVVFFVGMVVGRGSLEIAQHGGCCAAGVSVHTVRGQVRHQPTQRCALPLDAVVAGGQHLERHFKSAAGRTVAGERWVHDGILVAVGTALGLKLRV